MKIEGMWKVGNEMRRFDAESPKGDALIMVVNLDHFDTPIGECSTIVISLTEKATGKVVGNFTHDFINKVNMDEAMELVSESLDYSKG